MLSELQQQANELRQLVSNSQFLSDFQHKNYEILINNYYEPAESIAQDWENYKLRHDEPKATPANKTKYEGLMTKAEASIKPLTDALNNLKIEISNMEQIINKLDTINNKLDNLKPAAGGGTTSPQVDLTDTNNKLKDILDAVNKIKPSDNVDLTPLKDKLTEIQGNIKDIKPSPAVDISPVNNKLDEVKTALGNIKNCPCDITALSKKLEEVKTFIISEREKRVVDNILKNDDSINNNSSIVGTEKAFYKMLGDSGTTKDFLWIRQDPVSRNWGVLFNNKVYPNDLFYLSSMTDSQRQEDTKRLTTWLTNTGISRKINVFGNFPDLNKEGSSKYSLLFAVGTILFIIRAWGAGKDPKWEDLGNEKNWKPQAEIELNRYDN